MGTIFEAAMPVVVPVAIIAAGLAAVGGYLGGTECVGSALHFDWTEVQANCAGADRGGGEGSITKIQKLHEQLVSAEITMTFGEAEETLVYPEGSNGKLTKIDWDDPGIVDKGDDILGEHADGTRFVQNKPFIAAYVPCVKLGDDYQETLMTDPNQQKDPKKVQSAVSLEYQHGNLADPTLVTNIIAHTGPLAACFTHIPTETAAGQPNEIPFSHSDEYHMNNGVEATFDHVIRDLAVKFAQASACPAQLTNAQAIETHIGDYVSGAIARDQPELAGINVDVDMADSKAAQDLYTKEYQDAVKKYQDLKKSMFGDDDGNRKDMKIKFADKMLEIASCDSPPIQMPALAA